jgi:hypothetical protein
MGPLSRASLEEVVEHTTVVVVEHTTVVVVDP